MLKKTAKLLAPLVFASSLVAVVASPASAAGCNGYFAFAYPSSTDVYNDTCSLVQARIDRYYSGQVYTYTSAQSSSRAYVEEDMGTNAGNAARGYSGSGSWPSWDFM